MTLEQKQAAGAEVQKEMLEFMMQFAPTHQLKVGDVWQIAFHARTAAFNAFSKDEK